MLWSWVMIILIIGEIIVYFLLVAAKQVFPYVNNRVPFMGLFYTLCLMLFIMGSVSYFTYSTIRSRVQSLYVITEKFDAVSKLLDSVQDLEMNERRFLLTNNKIYLNICNRLQLSVTDRSERVHRVYSKSSNQDKVKILRELLYVKLGMVDRVLSLMSDGKHEEAEAAFVVNISRNTMNAILTAGRELEDQERDEFMKVAQDLDTLSMFKFYISGIVVFGSLVQIAIASTLGRSRKPC